MPAPDHLAPDPVAQRLGEAGYAVDVEEFPARASIDPWLAAYAGASAVAALLVYPAPLVAAVLGIVSIVLHARESEGRPLIRRWTTTARNTVARAPGAGTPEVIVVARVDPLARSARRPLVVSLQTSMAAVAAGGAAAWVAEAEAELPQTVAAGGAVAAAVVAILTLLLYRPPAGADPEAPAAELLPALASELRDRPIWLVATGGGLRGIGALLEAHEREVAGATWLNLEVYDGDEVVAVSEEGTWRERRADRTLMGTAEEAGAEVAAYRAAPTLATALLARRRAALTLLVPRNDPAPGVAVALAVARSRQ